MKYRDTTQTGGKPHWTLQYVSDCGKSMIKLGGCLLAQTLLPDCGNPRSNPVDFASVMTFFPKSSPLHHTPLTLFTPILSLTLSLSVFLQSFPCCQDSENGCTAQSLKPFDIHSATMDWQHFGSCWILLFCC